MVELSRSEDPRTPRYFDSSSRVFPCEAMISVGSPQLVYPTAEKTASQRCESAVGHASTRDSIMHKLYLRNMVPSVSSCGID